MCFLQRSFLALKWSPVLKKTKLFEDGFEIDERILRATMDQDMERCFSGPVLVSTLTQEDLDRDHQIDRRVSKAAPTRAEAREVGVLRRQEGIRHERTQSDSVVVLETTNTTGTGTPPDTAPEEKALRPTMKYEHDGSYDARWLRSALAEDSTQPINDPFAGRVAAM